MPTASSPASSPASTSNLAFATHLASRLPQAFLKAARPLIRSAYEQAYSADESGSELPYVKNVHPHRRNQFVAEQLHTLAEGLQIPVEARQLDNTYYYLELNINGLLIHIKHFNNHQPLRQQLVGATYRRALTTFNEQYGQQEFSFDAPAEEPSQPNFVILFFQDEEYSTKAVDQIYFILPSATEGNIIAHAQLEDVLACYLHPVQEAVPATDDTIPLPPQVDAKSATVAQ